MSAPHASHEMVRDRLRRENEELRLAAAVSRRRYQDLFHAAPDAYLVTGPTGRIVEANRAAEELLGVVRRFLVGKPLGVYLGRGGGLAAMLTDLERARGVVQRELVVTTRARSVDVSVTASTVYEEGSTGSAGTRWLLRDITAQKHAEREIRALNANLEQRVSARTAELEASNAVKDELLRELTQRARVEREFVANAAHELRTPLAAITSALDVLEAGAKLQPADRDRFLAHIRTQCDRLARLNATLLALARAQLGQEPPHVAPIDVAELVRRVAASLKLADGVALHTSVDDGLAVLAHPDLLEQAVVNIAENAAKYTTTGSVELLGRPRGPHGEIVVRDTGRGMEAGDVAHAFDRFYRADSTAENGFGLGLSIARQAIQALDGEIEIDSRPGAGTTVRILLERPA